MSSRVSSEAHVPAPAPTRAPIARAGLLLGPLLFLLVLLWPSALSQPQRGAAAVALLTAVYWLSEALPVGVTSLLPAALFPLLGVMSAKKVAPTYFDDIVLLFLGAMLLALGLERWNLHKRMALWIVARVGSSPRRLVLGFLVATAFLSLWLNNTATALMMLPIGLAVARTAGAGAAATPFARALLLSIAYGASVGGMGTPVGTAPNQVFLGQLRLRYPNAPEIGFGQWMLGWGPVVLLWIPLAWWLLTRVCLRVRGTSTLGAETIRAERAALGRMGRGERWMAAAFALTALLWITRVDLDLGALRMPGWARLFAREPAGTGPWVSDATVAVGMVILCFLLPVDRKRGLRLLDWDVAAKLPWDILLLIGGGFCLAEGIRSSGLDGLLGEALGRLFAGRSEWLVVLVVVAAVALFSEVASNTASAQVLLPVLATAAEAAQLNPLSVMAPATIAASVGFMLPVGTPPNALVYSTRLVPAPVMARVGLIMDLVLVALITLAYELWVRRVWGIESELPAWAAQR